MARQGISTGTVPNDGTGDTLLDGAVKINDNFVEVYDIIGDGTNTFVGIVTQITAGSNVSISTAYGSVEIGVTGISTGDIKSDTITAGVATITTLETTTFTGSGNAAGGTDNTFLNYTGTTKTDGSLYGGTDAPTNTTRLNYDGAFHATNVHGSHYGDGSNLNNLDAADLASGTVPDARFPSELPAISGTELTGIVTSITAGTNITVSGSTGNVTINASAGSGSTANIRADEITVSGVSTFNGDVNLGQSSFDTLTINADIASNLDPDADGTRFIGADGNRWSNIYGVGLDVSGTVSAGGSVTGASIHGTTVHGSGVELTGIVTSITAGTNITVSGSTGNVTINASGGGGGSGIAIGIASSEDATITTVGTGITQINVIGAGYTVTVDSNVARLKNVAMALTDISFTSAGVVTYTVGEQLSYTATTNYTKSKFIVENRAGLAIGINYDTGIMGGGQNASVGIYTATLRAGDLFGITEPFSLTIEVEEAPPLNMNTLFTPPDSLPLYDNQDTGHAYVALASGGVVVQDGSYVIDRDASIAGFSSDFGLYYNNVDEKLFSYRFGSPNDIEDVNLLANFVSLPSVTDGTIASSYVFINSNSTFLGFATSYSNMLGRTSGIGETSAGGRIMPLYDEDIRPLGLKYLKLTPDASDGIFDNAFTKVSGATTCAYGFTLEDPWICHGGIPQLLSEESETRMHHNGFGGSYSSSTFYDQVIYGDYNSGPFSSSSVLPNGMGLDGRVGSATSTVQVVWDPDKGSGTYTYYIDGVFIADSTGQATYMPSTGSTDPVLAFGDTTHMNGGIIPDGTSSYRYPVPWIFRIRDFWFSNSGITTANVSGVGTFRDRNVSDWDEYSNVDFYMTIDEVGVTTVKGNVTVAQGDVTDGGTPVTRMF